MSEIFSPKWQKDHIRIKAKEMEFQQLLHSSPNDSYLVIILYMFTGFFLLLKIGLQTKHRGHKPSYKIEYEYHVPQHVEVSL